MDQAMKHKFRTDDQVNQWLLCAWNQAKGSFYPAHESKRGRSFNLNPNILENMCKAIMNQQYPQIGINDTMDNIEPERSLSKIIKAFETILPEAVTLYDGTRPYWPSSPSKGWGRPESLTEGDVHYWGVWWGELPYEVYREKVGRFNSEYGYQSYPDYSTLLKIAEGEELSKDAEVIAAHQKHARGTRQIDDFIKRYYPDAQPKDFEEYVHLSQLSQAYGMEIAIEAHRTAKPYNMGTLYWQLNDAWPVTSWSSIDYYGNPKVLQERLKTLYAPVLLSLDRKDYGVFVTSDLLRNIDGTLTIKVCNLEDLKLDELEDHPLFEQKVKVEMDANENRKFVVEGLSEYLRNLDLQKVYVKLQLTEGEVVTAERKCYFSAFFE